MSMALKPPPLGDVLQQVNEIVGPAGLAEEVDRNARQLLQSALRRLDFVSREEFDAQSAILARAHKRVAALESELAVLTEQVTALETRAQTAPDPAREPEPGTSPEPGPA
jgi:BMFP domain-containing protein YqiC